MSPLSLRRVGWRGWSRRSEVERVRLYAVTSVEAVMWLTMLLVVVSGLSGRRPELAVLSGLAMVALGLIATRLLRAAATAYPVRGRPPRAAAVTLVVLVVVVVSGTLLLPDGLRQATAGLAVATLALGLGGFRSPWLGLALLVAVPLGLGLADPRWPTVVYGLLVALLLVGTIRSSLWLLSVVTELDRARGAQAALAVAEERLRFSRDVHDVLGRRLSTISLQAELAAALARRGDPTAADRMGEVRGTAHEALREARELARGYRPASLAQELEGARSLLRAAGIACDLSVGGLPDDWHEPAAWVVREAVTNVLRHSTARAVQVAYAEHGDHGGVLSVANDGVTAGPGPAGSGLAGLAERLAPLGASLESGREGDRHVLRVILPARPTATAAATATGVTR